MLRGVHPTVNVARDGLKNVRRVPLPDKPTKRRSLRARVRSITILLIFGGSRVRARHSDLTFNATARD